MTEEELKEELAKVMAERDDALAHATDAQIDAEEIDRLRAEGKTAEEALDAVQAKLGESESAREKLQFTTKRDKALAELGLKADNPAVKLAFPDDAVLDDAAFAGRVESLKAIVATQKPAVPPVPPGGGGDEPPDPERAKWGQAGGITGESHIVGDEAKTEAEKRAAGAREAYKRTRDPRDLARGGVFGRIMQLVQRRSPGGSTFYDRKEVKR